jgi:5'-3' exonuclease
MILIDFSALLHQNVYGAISGMKPEKDENGKYITDQFISYTKYLIIQEILDFKKRFKNYGNVVLCLDCHSSANWRLDVYKPYKGSRHAGREQSPINWGEVYSEINALEDALRNFTSLNVVMIEHAEGDDVILCLADFCARNHEKTMIISADKDLIQAQKYPEISQYSPITRKFVTAEDKDNSMQDWHNDHIYLGDASDEVPSVFKNLVFTDKFTEYIKTKNLNVTPEMFEERHELIEQVSEKFGANIFKSLKVGPATLKKLIARDDELLKNPLLLKRLKRNEQLVLMEYIPESIKNECKNAFNTLNAPKTYNRKEFETYLTENHCENLIVQCNELETGEIDISFFDF